jgi:hypothetical protein
MMCRVPVDEMPYACEQCGCDIPHGQEISVCRDSWSETRYFCSYECASDGLADEQAEKIDSAYERARLMLGGWRKE